MGSGKCLETAGQSPDLQLDAQLDAPPDANSIIGGYHFYHIRKPLAKHFLTMYPTAKRRKPHSELRVVRNPDGTINRIERLSGAALANHYQEELRMVDALDNAPRPLPQKPEQSLEEQQSHAQPDQVSPRLPPPRSSDERPLRDSEGHQQPAAKMSNKMKGKGRADDAPQSRAKRSNR